MDNWNEGGRKCNSPVKCLRCAELEAQLTAARDKYKRHLENINERLRLALRETDDVCRVRIGDTRKAIESALAGERGSDG